MDSLESKLKTGLMNLISTIDGRSKCTYKCVKSDTEGLHHKSPTVAGSTSLTRFRPKMGPKTIN